MGRKVSNSYTINEGVSVLCIISFNYYEVAIAVDTSIVDKLKMYGWCFDQGKGLAYTMDLTMLLPRYMGYKTPRVYLRDFVLYSNGMWDAHGATMLWNRPDPFNYTLSHGAKAPRT